MNRRLKITFAVAFAIIVISFVVVVVEAPQNLGDWYFIVIGVVAAVCFVEWLLGWLQEGDNPDLIADARDGHAASVNAWAETMETISKREAEGALRRERERSGMPRCQVLWLFIYSNWPDVVKEYVKEEGGRGRLYIS